MTCSTLLQSNVSVNVFKMEIYILKQILFHVKTNESYS